LISCTSPTHPDVPQLKSTKAKIKEIADYINDRKRVKDQSQDVIRIYNILKPSVQDLVQPGRHLLMEGTLVELDLQKPLADQESSYFFLFNDLLIKTREKRKGEKYKVEKLIQLREYTVVRNPDPDTRAPLDPSITKPKYHLPPGTFLLRADGPNMLLHAATLVDSDKWSDAIDNAIGSVMRKLSTLKITPEARVTNVKDQIARQYTDPNLAASMSSLSPPNSPNASGLRLFAQKKQHATSASVSKPN
jgi:hypothetical protein